MAEFQFTIDTTLDLRGWRCPHLLIAILKTAAKLQPGETLQVLADDLNAPSNIAAWARQSGNTLHDIYQEGDYFVFLLERQFADGELKERL